MKLNSKKSLMQTALGEQWDLLPKALKNHYSASQEGENLALGSLDIDYPWFMQWPLTVLKLMGALVNRRGKGLTTKVSKSMRGEKQLWHRSIEFPDGKVLSFNSVFVAHGNHQFIEYVNTFLGLKMQAFVKQGRLHYESKGYILKLGRFKLPIPEALALGHASIIESAYHADDKYTFDMDFRIKHPLFGEVFSYKGRFVTQKQ